MVYLDIIALRCQKRAEVKTDETEKNQTSFAQTLDRKRRMDIIRSRPKKRGGYKESCLTKKSK
jgi:hypothetical protein